MKIFYAVTPKHSAVTRFADEGDHKRVYDLVEQITDNHELAEKHQAGVSWRLPASFLTQIYSRLRSSRMSNSICKK